MKQNITQTPERWVILKMDNTYYKVFGSWSGSYLVGESWKLNSGIKKVEQDEEFYYFIGFSNSCYKCCKKSYGINTLFTRSVLNQIIERGNGLVELLDDVDDWSTVIE